MTDREQVIYDIERCICHVPNACKDCSKFCAYETRWDCMESLLSDALALLREQDETANNPLFQRHDCGALIVYRGRDVCPNCGRKVEWD